MTRRSVSRRVASRDSLTTSRVTRPSHDASLLFNSFFPISFRHNQRSFSIPSIRFTLSIRQTISNMSNSIDTAETNDAHSSEDTSASGQTKRSLSSTDQDTTSTAAATDSEETVAPSEGSSVEPPPKKTKVDTETGNGDSETIDPTGLPADHLNHQENWATGEDSATGPQLGFIDALNSKAGLAPLSAEEKAELGKSAASVMIDDLKHGRTGDRKAADDGDDDKLAAAGKKSVEGTKESEDTTLTKKEASPKKPDQKAEPESETTESKTEPPAKMDEPAHKLENTTAAEPAPSDADPDSHLAHPESWATGEDPATGKQLGYLAVLAKQKGVELTEEEKTKMGKSEASEKIDELRHQ